MLLFIVNMLKSVYKIVMDEKTIIVKTRLLLQKVHYFILQNTLL